MLYVPMHVLFWLRRQKTNSDGRVPIYCRITVSGTRCPDFSTHILVPADIWDSANQKIKGKDPVAEVYNSKLNHIRAALEAIHLDMLVKGEAITALAIKDRFLGKTTTMPSFMALANLYLDHLQNENVRGEITADTLRIHKNRFNLIQLFLKDSNQEQMLAKDLRPAFMGKLEDFLKNKYSTELSHNYCMKVLQEVKSILAHGVNLGHLAHSPLAHFKLKKLRKVTKIYLTWEELQKLCKYPFANVTLKNQVKVFVFQCLTGLSYVDLETFSKDPESFLRISKEGRKYIDMARGKNAQNFVVPLLPPAEKILKDYGYQLPVISNQVYNRMLKEIAAVVGITKNLTTKAARKTFGNIISDMQVSLDSIAAMYGHTSKSMSEQYYVQLSINRVMGEFETKGIFEKMELLEEPFEYFRKA